MDNPHHLPCLVVPLCPDEYSLALIFMVVNNFFVFEKICAFCPIFSLIDILLDNYANPYYHCNVGVIRGYDYHLDCGRAVD